MNTTCERCGQSVPGYGGIAFDPETGVVRFGADSVYLTNSERQVFGLLFRRSGAVVNRYALYDHLYSLKPECDWPDVKVVDVYVHKIRRKLRALGIEIRTHWGVGYAVMPPQATAGKVAA